MKRFIEYFFGIFNLKNINDHYIELSLIVISWAFIFPTSSIRFPLLNPLTIGSLIGTAVGWLGAMFIGSSIVKFFIKKKIHEESKINRISLIVAMLVYLLIWNL